MTRRGLGLFWVLMALLVTGLFSGILWSQSADAQRRAGRALLASQADLLARGAHAHALHKVERCLVYFEERLAERQPAVMDVGKEDPEFLRGLSGELVLEGGKGGYRVIAMQVTRQPASGGGRVFKVAVAAESAVEIAGRRRRERLRGEYRLFSTPESVAEGVDEVGR